MKQTSKKGTSASCCTARQKVWGVIALAGLFACGLMVGLSINNARVQNPNIACDTNCDCPDVAENNIDASNQEVCAEIETLLISQLPAYDMADSDMRIDRAKIYANLSERGCPENSQLYVELAAKELEIARALSDDNFSEPETVEVVETYKRLQMKQAAQDVIDKVQKITEPAIDFILQVEKIINE